MQRVLNQQHQWQVEQALTGFNPICVGVVRTAGTATWFCALPFGIEVVKKPMRFMVWRSLSVCVWRGGRGEWGLSVKQNPKLSIKGKVKGAA